MNISFYILLLFVVSTYAGKLQPKPLGLKETKRYVGSGIGASGIQSSSSVNSANVRQTRSTINTSFRTLVIKRENEICFSKYPVHMCNSGATASQTESKEIDLVCMGRNSHPLVQQWAEQSQQRIITEVADLSKTETYAYNAPIKCHN